jgi:dTDP-4-amino-4,6-dideoxygalactose transaminase|uniref:DegT/DnrJ/EryC1/StrS family aminotransferase n=1 Tax=Mesoaciditoga lauensis TaxID=1495039 RepID=A0A7V3VSM8_9BACT
MRVPLFDLTRQYKKLREEMLKKIDETISGGIVILGQNVEEIEDNIAKYVGVQHAVAVASGSDALLLALQAMGIKKGDHVLTTPYTFFATASAITRLGATPVFADINEDFNIDVVAVKKAIESDKDIKVVLPVHLFGKSADMETLKEICSIHNVKILEDAAQSIGSEVSVGGHYLKTASIGDAGILSFFPTKNLGAYGDAGMVLTNSEEIAENVKMLRVHGARQKYVHEVIGYNSRMDEIQAAVLNVKIGHLDEWIDLRRNAAKKYDQLLEGLDIVHPIVPKERSHVFHQYVILVDKRDELKEFLSTQGVGTAVYYPIPLHLQKCFAFLGYKAGDFPVSERLSRSSIALPIFPEITFKEQEYVVEQIKKFYLEATI